MGKYLAQFKRNYTEESWEKGKTIIKPSAEDMKWITLLMCYSSQFGQDYAGRMIRERLKLSGKLKLWSRWRCAEKLIDQVMDALYDTLPYRSMKHVVDMCDNGEVYMRLRPVTHEPGKRIMDTDDLQVLCDAALCRDECRFCLKEGRELKQCRLRQVLEVMLPPSGVRPRVDSCPYRHAEME